MKRLQLTGLIFLGICAINGLFATSSFAEETFLSEWLIEEVSVVTSLPINYTEEFLLIDEKASGRPAVICGQTVVGTVNTDGEGTITKILNSTGEEIAELGGLAILCKGGISVCENSATDVELWPMKLPWTTLLISMLPEGKLFFLEWITGGVYTLSCLVVGLKTEDECKMVENTSLEVDDGPISAQIPAGAEIAPLADCSIGGTGSGYMKLQNNVQIASPEGIVNAEVF